MSSLADGDAVPKIEAAILESQAAPSQVSEANVESQSGITSTVPSQVTPMVSQEISGTAESAISSTVNDASQSQPSQLFSQAAPSMSSADTDTTMMPPPTPTGTSQGAVSGLARSSGRAIKPTLKLRGEGDEVYTQRTASGSSSQGLQNGSQNYGLRHRKPGGSSNARAPRLKLNLTGGHASRGKGDPTLAGVDKTIPYMQGYDRELDSSDDEAGEGMAFEEQLILRMPEGHEATKVLGDWVRRREVGNDGREVEVKFKDSRRALFKMGEKQFSAKLVDLPAIIESHKTLDNKQVFKIADISQMLLVTHQIREESEVTRADGLDKVEGLTDDFIYDHGITPPMKWARKRRFRQRIHKRTIETVEKEVERLLAEDERAENVEYAMIDVAETDLSDSDEDGVPRLRRGGDGGSHGGSQGDTTSIAMDGASVMSDLEDEFSQMGEQEESRMEDDDVDQDLQRELEQEMLLQQQEDEEDEDEGSTRNSMRGRSMSRATSDDDDEDDEEDDLFDAGDEDDTALDGDAEDGANEADDDDDDDLDEEEQEQRVRETQLEAECKEIEAMVKRKNNEVEATINALIKQRNLQTLKRMQTELDMKRSQLLDLRQQRREGKEAAKAEAQAQAEAAAVAASNRASSSAAPSAGAGSSATPALNLAASSALPTHEGATATEREKGQSTTKETPAPAFRKPVVAANDMDVDQEAEEGPEGDGEEEEDDDEEDESDESELFG
jgi:transcription initiation factor TFIID subunit 7